MAMSKRPSDKSVEFSVTIGHGGSFEAAYLRFGDSKIVRTEEVEEDTLLADYDARGRLVGIEVIGPVDAAELTRLVAQPHRAVLRRLFRQTVPQLLAG